MITDLHIQNYALLKDLKIEFEKGLNILTGETGAGKSIIIGALNIALGERVYTENIRTGEEKATVEVVFNLADNKNLLNEVNQILEEAGIEKIEDNLIIKREINRSGKGKIFINNSTAALNILQKISKLLVDMHGQHEHQSLLKNEIHIDLLDDYANTFDIRNEIKNLYQYLLKLQSEIEELKKIENEKQEKLDFINFRINEIENLNLKTDNELEELYSKRNILVNIESIKQSVQEVLNSFSPSSLDIEGIGIIDLLNNVKKNLINISKVDKKGVENFINEISEIEVKVEEIKDFFIQYNQKLNFDKNELTQIEERIEIIEEIMKKYKKNSISEIKSYYEELKKEKSKIEMNDEIIKEKEKQKKEILNKLKEKSLKLSEIRQIKGRELSKKIEEELKDLGISKGIFIIKVNQIEANEDDFFIDLDGKKVKITEQGIDNVEFLISLNPGEEPKPLIKIASGGEISRIMLAIKNILSEVDKVPVMVFDEIDTGISGKIADVVGKKMFEISKKKQVICITHLPQIASYGDVHYSVGKEIKDGKTETFIKKLDKKEKIVEIAKLLSGEKITDASLKAAEELLNKNKKN